MSELAEQFERLWESNGCPPNVFDFLDEYEGHDSSERFAVVLRDQRRRWMTDRPLTVEDYLARIPEIGRNPVWKCDLVLSEFNLRRSSGDPMPMDVVVARFPDISDQLRSKLSREDTDCFQETAGTAITQELGKNAAIDRERFGRYLVIRAIGEGGYGRVYLGVDDELQRQVAIKVPTAERFRREKDAEAYLKEARMVASLDHPHIVPVLDVGRTDDGMIYVVSKFIEGHTLHECIQEKSLSHEQGTALMAAMAQALQHSHQRRLIHRDIKPGNILIEEATGTAYLADFGLATHEEDYLNAAKLAGTPSYMSPEQARGEGHRLDGRSDIFSLGIVFYQLLTGKRPFRGSTANEILYQVVSVDPPSPRELDDSIPVELERICLKALSKKRSDRYASAEEMANDLANWQQQPEAEHKVQPIVPRGIRSFEATDADFFLDLLPGPRNRDGLPESIQFWKTRMEQTDPEATFGVGLIYGPSGCGKSSLVKAGLLPRLSKKVVTIYVEATPTETETRIQRRIARYFPEAVAEDGLVKTFLNLRKSTDHKVVLIIDQFEQWLHAHPADPNADLLDALRQCDGGKLQAIVMVRDDFAMAAVRFMDAIDVPITQGQNFAAVDLFDEDHAIKLLHRFGQAFGKLPAKRDDLSEDQRQFLTSAASGLAHDGKVVSVQLTLFAEMVKGRPWVTSTLREVGGTKGVGANFLEEKFGSRSANPKHFQHATASRNVLKALLPDVGSDIKGHMRSHEELMQISGYENRQGDFNELLRILDGELRLITPTDPEGIRSDSGSNVFSKHYQLTHDYLVPSLREWLTRKQAETRRGRAELRLDECASLWSRKRQPRFLPSLWEYANAKLLVDRRQLTETQHQMMGQATKFWASRAALLVIALALLVWGGRLLIRSQHTATLVRSLATAETIDVPEIINDLELGRRWANPLLEEMLEDSALDSKERLHASLALLPVDADQLDFLNRRMLSAHLREFVVIRDALVDHREQLVEPLWMVLENEHAAKGQRLRAAMALATYDPPREKHNASKWQGVAPLIVDQLIDSALLNPSQYDLLTRAMKPASAALKETLSKLYRSHQESASRSMGTALLVSFAADSPKGVAAMFLDAQLEQIPNLIPLLDQHRAAILPLMQQEVGAFAKDETMDLKRLDVEQARRISHAAALLIRFGKTDGLWELLRFPDRPIVRSYLIHRLNALGVPPETVFAQLEEERDESIRRALVQVLGDADYQTMSKEQHDRIVGKVRQLYFEDPDSGMHSTAEWLLRKWGVYDQGMQEELQETSSRRTTDASWRTTSQGQTMVVVDAMNVPSIGRKIEIASTEIDIGQFRRFDPTYKTSEPNDDMHPAGSLTWFKAVQYCRWLSVQEGIAEDQMCYPPLDLGHPNGGDMGDDDEAVIVPYPDYLQRNGYRLPTTGEWIYSCFERTSHQIYSDGVGDLFGQYAWTYENASEYMPTGLLKPNGIGLFDMCSNVREWCADRRSEDHRYTRGGTLSARQSWANRESFPAIEHFRSIGFRVARTLESRKAIDAEPPLSDLTEASLRWAMQKCDLLGERVFRELFDRQRMRKASIVQGGIRYPFKAVIAAAYSHQFGTTSQALKNVHFASKTAASWTEQLGFDVVGE